METGDVTGECPKLYLLAACEDANESNRTKKSGYCLVIKAHSGRFRAPPKASFLVAEQRLGRAFLVNGALLILLHPLAADARSALTFSYSDYVLIGNISQDGKRYSHRGPLRL